VEFHVDTDCRNPSFGLVTKAKGIARVRAKEDARELSQEEAQELSQEDARESRQRHCKSAGQEEARESHHILLGVLESVRE